MPDNAAALAGRIAFEQALHGKLDCTELLVASNHLDGLAFFVGGEKRKGTDDVEQIVPIEHTCHQALLVVRAAGSVL